MVLSRARIFMAIVGRWRAYKTKGVQHTESTLQRHERFRGDKQPYPAILGQGAVHNGGFLER